MLASGAEYAVKVYSEKMNLIAIVKLPIPGDVLGINTIIYKNYFYLVYQYLQDNIVYCTAAKFNPNGDLDGAPAVIDSASVTNESNITPYNLIISEDKSRILFYKLSVGADVGPINKTILFDSSLNLVKKSIVGFRDVNIQNALTNFSLANDGTLVFLKQSGTSVQGKTIINVISKAPMSDSVEYADFSIAELNLGTINLKIDNINKHFLIAAFNATKKGKEIDGLFTSVWSLDKLGQLSRRLTTFSHGFKDSTRGDVIKQTFNLLSIRDMILRRDGGFIVLAESSQVPIFANLTTISAAQSYTNYDYYNSSRYLNRVASDPKAFDKPINNPDASYSPENRGGSTSFRTSTLSKIFALSFDNVNNIEWAKILTNLSDKIDNRFTGYTFISVGGRINIYYNRLVKRQAILYGSSISGDGQVSEDLPLHNLDFRYSFMPQQAKQIAANQLIVPFIYKKHLSFANMVF